MDNKLAIKGHSTRGNEVIELLEMMGGENYLIISGCNLSGYEPFNLYYINDNGVINYKHHSLNKDMIVFTLEEFLEKYPYKVGDKVTLDNKLCSIIWMCWECNNIYYYVEGTDSMFAKKVTAEKLKSYKETNMNEDNYRETFKHLKLKYLDIQLMILYS